MELSRGKELPFYWVVLRQQAISLPLVIGRSAKPGCFRNKVLADSILYKYNKKAWMTGEFFEQHLRLFDSKNRHPISQHNFQNSAYGFRNYQELQNFLQNILVRKIIVLMEGGEVYEPDLFQAIKWVRRSWNVVTTDTIVNCFRHCGVHATEDDGSTIEETSFMDELNGILSSFPDAQDGTVSPQEFVEIEDLVYVADSYPPQLFLDEELSNNSPDNESEIIEVVKPSRTEVAKSLEVLGRFFIGNEIAENAIVDPEKELTSKQQSLVQSPSDYFFVIDNIDYFR